MHHLKLEEKEKQKGGLRVSGKTQPLGQCSLSKFLLPLLSETGVSCCEFNNFHTSLRHCSELLYVGLSSAAAVILKYSSRGARAASRGKLVQMCMLMLYFQH